MSIWNSNNTDFCRKKLSFATVFILTVTLASCDVSDSTGDDEPGDGISDEIREFVDDGTLTLFEDSLEVPVYRGDSPPDIEAILSSGNQGSGSMSIRQDEDLDGMTVAMSPYELDETLVPDDGHKDLDSFQDLYIRFYDQDMDENEISMDMMHADENVFEGAEGYITGDEEGFSIFVEQEFERNGHTQVYVTLFSGVATPEGIEEPHDSYIISDDGGADDGPPEGTGRSYIDANNLAEIDEWPEISEELHQTFQSKTPGDTAQKIDELNLRFPLPELYER